jgi:CelD/BcsL family acetyltransferase involved in cellulose biosynthesis
MTERLSLEELETCATDFDHSVELQSGIDRFCSRSEWILPFHRAFLPDRELFVYRGGSDGTSFAALAAREDPSVGRYLEALENMWCFACPLIGEDAALLLQAAAQDLAREQQPDHHGAPLLLSGIPASRNPKSLLARIVRDLGDSHELRAVDATQRFVAALAGGVDGFLSRRSRSFRKSLRRAERQIRDEGLVFHHVEVGTAVAARGIYPRILAIEAKSWKSAQGNGADQGSMALFYRDMLPRVASRGGLRLLIVTHEGSPGEAEDVAYLHGALTGDHFRGLQMSFDRRLAHLSLGNLMQLEMLRALCEEGVQSYDLGTRSDYKRRWAEEGLRTLTILARPR